MVPHAIDRERGYCRGISLDFVLPLPRRNSFLPRESSGGLGRRLAGLAGTGTLAAEDSKHLPDTGDSRRDRFYPPERGVLEGLGLAFGSGARHRRGNPEKAAA